MRLYYTTLLFEGRDSPRSHRRGAASFCSDVRQREFLS